VKRKLRKIKISQQWDLCNFLWENFVFFILKILFTIFGNFMSASKGQNDETKFFKVFFSLNFLFYPSFFCYFIKHSRIPASFFFYARHIKNSIARWALDDERKWVNIEFHAFLHVESCCCHFVNKLQHFLSSHFPSLIKNFQESPQRRAECTFLDNVIKRGSKLTVIRERILLRFFNEIFFFHRNFCIIKNWYENCHQFCCKCHS
jgi:hypothetical protein